jgi:hypothetical protein
LSSFAEGGGPAVAVVLAVAFLVVIPGGDMLLPSPYPGTKNKSIKAGKFSTAKK